MSLLRDPVEAAISQVASGAEQSANLYDDAGRRASDPDVKALFEHLAAERRALAEDLCEVVRSMGELPEAPDPDAEFLHRLVNAARAFFAEEDRALLEDRERAEAELEQAIDAALAEALPEAVQRRLETAKRRIGDFRSRLRSEARNASAD